MPRKVNVIGVGMGPFAKPGKSEEYHVMARKAGEAALADAKIPFTDVQQANGGRILAYHQVAEVLAETVQEQLSLKALVLYFVKQVQYFTYILVQDAICDTEVIILVEDVQVLNGLGIRDFAIAEAHHLVEQ